MIGPTKTGVSVALRRQGVSRPATAVNSLWVAVNNLWEVGERGKAGARLSHAQIHHRPWLMEDPRASLGALSNTYIEKNKSVARASSFRRRAPTRMLKLSVRSIRTVKANLPFVMRHKATGLPPNAFKVARKIAIAKKVTCAFAICRPDDAYNRIVRPMQTVATASCVLVSGGTAEPRRSHPWFVRASGMSVSRPLIVRGKT